MLSLVFIRIIRDHLNVIFGSTMMFHSNGSTSSFITLVEKKVEEKKIRLMEISYSLNFIKSGFRNTIAHRAVASKYLTTTLYHGHSSVEIGKINLINSFPYRHTQSRILFYCLSTAKLSVTSWTRFELREFHSGTPRDETTTETFHDSFNWCRLILLIHPLPSSFSNAGAWAWDMMGRLKTSRRVQSFTKQRITFKEEARNFQNLKNNLN